MKFSENYMLSSIADKTVAIPVGQNVANFSSIVQLNETGEFILNCLEKDLSLEELRECLYKEYEAEATDKPILDKDLDEFLENARQKGLVVD